MKNVKPVRTVAVKGGSNAEKLTRMALAFNAEDVRKAEGLKRTQAARAANKARQGR